jgi:hypothetical protein
MFFDFTLDYEKASSALSQSQWDPEPGRISMHHGLLVQDEFEYKGWCQDRADNGYNSGMGEIFRRVAMISPIDDVTATKASSLPAPSALELEANVQKCESL